MSGPVFSQSIFTTGQKADLVLGPFAASTTRNALNHPQRVSSDGRRLFVADTRNHRVLIWNRIPSKSNVPPDIVVGQKNFAANDSGSGPAGLNFPMGVHSDGRRLFVADADNNRILIWNRIPTSHGAPADIVLGQVDFATTARRPNDPSATSWPWDVVSDGRKLYVACTMGSRTLIWNRIPTRNNEPANLVLGQKDFYRSDLTSERGCMMTPRTLAVEGGVLVVGDYNAETAMIWLHSPTKNGQTPDVILQDRVLAQYEDSIRGFTQQFHNDSWSLTMKNGRLLIGGNFIYVWDKIPTRDNQRYDRVFGGDFDSWEGGWGMHDDGRNIYVSQMKRSRVVGYRGVPSDPGAPADFVLGYPDLKTNVFFGKTGIRSPLGLFSTGAKLLINSLDHRIVLYQSLPLRPGRELDTLIGIDPWGENPNLFNRAHDPISRPNGMWSDGLGLLVSDADRIIYAYDRIPVHDNQYPDAILVERADIDKIGTPTIESVCRAGDKMFAVTEIGQLLIWNRASQLDGRASRPPDAVMKFPYRLFSVTSDGIRLVVTTMDSTILIWRQLPSRSGDRPNLRLQGVPYHFNLPMGAVIHDDRLFVADTSNNRVCVYDRFPTSSRQPYDVVLGQPDLYSSAPGKSRERMLMPARVTFDGEYLWVSEFKFGDRVLGYKSRAATGRPVAPARFAARASSNNQVNLTWTDAARNERGYKLEYRIKGSGGFRVYGFPNANSTKVTATGLAKNTAYEFRLTAFNSRGASRAVLAAARTKNAANTPPRKLLKLHPRTEDQESNLGNRDAFVLRWGGGDPDPGDKVSYDVYFGTDPEPPLVSRGQAQTLYCGGTRAFLPGGATYYWKVVARDQEGATTTGPVWSFTTPVGPAEGMNTLQVNGSPGGRTSLSPGTYFYPSIEYETYHYRAVIIACPDEGYTFAGWEGDVPEALKNTNPLLLPFDQARSVAPRFVTRYPFTAEAVTGVGR